MPPRASAHSPRNEPRCSAARKGRLGAKEDVMDFTLSPEQEELIRTLRAFAKKELAPRSAHWDRSGEFPWEAWRKMGELGLLGLRTPAAFGGQETDLLTMGIASEEIARGDFSCTYAIQLAGLAGEIL